MKFIAVRDLRSKSSQIWKSLPKEKDVVITLNGKPVAILSATSGDNLEETLQAIRTARALTAVEAMQLKATQAGLDRMSLQEINAEIQAERKSRHS
ncbi:MAG: type II toxin-antitoxin system Phd/YefM family antitoxin [Candidatus Omnitrophica bacterium]|nr:type II toxin-antitoxin system Phd/YefM family antitoxin [Candidatus Omnitrophota bacterium]